MKQAVLSVAGKTFLAGEYLALLGGPALLLATDPRFQLKVKLGEANSETAKNPFHSQSPAGIFFAQHREIFSKYQLEFVDPYSGIGGFGASSAQFALLHALKQTGEEVFGESEKFIDWHEMVSDYRSQFSENKLGHQPSGADVVAAVSGTMTWFDRDNGKVQTFAWPFQEYEFALFHTGQKLSTHDHLKTRKDFDSATMGKALQEVHQGLCQVYFPLFLNGLRVFRKCLEQSGLVAPHTKEILQELENDSEAIFAKGCGAAGSDVIFVLSKVGKMESVANSSPLSGLRRIAGVRELSSGFKVQGLLDKSAEVLA